MTNYRFQQLTIQSCNYQSELFALAALSISILNDTVFHFNSKKFQFSGHVVGFMYVEIEQFLLAVCIFFLQYLETMLSPSGQSSSQTPTASSSARARKRKRLREAVCRLVQNESPALHKRRSSISDAGLLSMSGSFLDCTVSPEKPPDGTFCACSLFTRF